MGKRRKSNRIDWFDGTDHDFLSNFHPSPWVVYEDWQYPTVEHAFQAAKTTKRQEARRIRQAPTPGQAKYLGRSRQLHLRADWDEVKYGIMLDLVHQKFTDSPLTQLLLDTGTAELVEGNNWHDNIWGNCVCGQGRCERPGSNWLGEILMKVRDANR